MKKHLYLLLCLSITSLFSQQANAQMVVTDPTTIAAITATSQEIVAAIGATEILAESGNAIFEGVLGNLDEYVGYARDAIKIANDLIATYGASKEFIQNLSLTSVTYSEYFKTLEILARNSYLFTSGEINYLVYCLDYAAFGITVDIQGTARTVKGLENIANGAIKVLEQIYQAVSGGNITIIDIRNSIREASATIRNHYIMVGTVKGFLQRSIILKKLELGYYEDMKNTYEIREKFNIK